MTHKVVRSALLLLAAVLVFGCSNSSSNVGTYEFMGGSMEPTFHDGDSVKVVVLGDDLPSRGDIVVFIAPDQAPGVPERYFIKRVIALPNETVEVRSGSVYINGEPLSEPYSAEAPAYTYPLTLVQPDHYFVLGDNRNNSSDSHSWGTVPITKILGRANAKQ